MSSLINLKSGISGTGMGMGISGSSLSGSVNSYANQLKENPNIDHLKKHHMPKLKAILSGTDYDEFERFMRNDGKALLQDQRLGFQILMTGQGMKWMKTDSGLQFLTNQKDGNETYLNVIAFLRNRPESANQIYAQELNEAYNNYIESKYSKDGFIGSSTAQGLQNLQMAAQTGFIKLPAFLKS
jgi:hypothetical protein